MITKWWLQSPPALHLYKLKEACWGLLEEKMNQIVDWIHFNSMPPTAVDLLWEELPNRPTDLSLAKKEYIQGYETLAQDFGTVQSLQAVQTLFGLSYLEWIDLRSPSFPYRELYGPQCLRIRLDPGTNDMAVVSQYIRHIAPARCKFASDILYPRHPGGLGKVKLGRTLADTAYALAHPPAPKTLGLGISPLGWTFLGH